jgi:hypothetical protein
VRTLRRTPRMGLARPGVARAGRASLHTQRLQGILRKLRPLATSWHGRLHAQMPGRLSLNFCASIHDLGDAGLAIIDLEGSPGGPLEVTLVVPTHRRARIRKDFAF